MTRIPSNFKEVTTPKEFFSRLKSADAITVKAIVGLVKSLSEQHKQEAYQKDPFFAIYGIGGNVTKLGNRPDIDLLIVTNSIWVNGYSGEESDTVGGEWVAGTIRDVFRDEGYKVKVEKKIPNEYTRVGAGKKGMIRLTPEDEERKPIDVVIVNHTSLRDLGDKRITTLKEFEELDVDEQGNPLPRVLLFSS